MKQCISCKTEPGKNDAKYDSFGVCDPCHIKINKKIDEERLMQSILITAAEEFAEEKAEALNLMERMYAVMGNLSMHGQQPMQHTGQLFRIFARAPQRILPNYFSEQMYDSWNSPSEETGETGLQELTQLDSGLATEVINFLEKMDILKNQRLGRALTAGEIDERKFTYPKERPAIPTHRKPTYKPKDPERIPHKRRRRFSIQQLVDSAGSMESWKDWYERNDGIIEEIFGADTDLLKSLLALTSPNNAVKGNVTQAMKAYVKILKGEEIRAGKRSEKEAHFMPNHADNINKMLRGEPIGGAKVIPFEKNMFGDREAVTVDLHMQELLYGRYDPKKKKYITPKEILSKAQTMYYADKMIRKVAENLGWKPSQAQAAMWAFNLELRGDDVVSYDGTLEERANQLSGGHGPYVPQVRELQDEFGTFDERGSGIVTPFGVGSPDEDEFDPGSEQFLDRIEEGSEQGQKKKRPGSDPLEDFDPLLR